MQSVTRNFGQSVDRHAEIERGEVRKEKGVTRQNQLHGAAVDTHHSRNETEDTQHGGGRRAACLQGPERRNTPLEQLGG